MKTKHNFKLYMLLLSLTTLWSGGLRAQVTIGDGTSPQKYSILEIVSHGEGGLRLPQLTTKERNDLTDAAFKADPLAEGLSIFNIDTKCVETWNGTVWINMCADVAGSIGSLSCGINSVSAINGEAVSSGNTFSIPYSGKTGDNIVLTNGAPLGLAVSGLTVVANGNQTLSAASGVINIKVTGTPTATSNFTLSWTLGGQSCTISVNISTKPTPQAPLITIQPQDVTVQWKQGATVPALSVTATGDAPLSYTWKNEAGSTVGTSQTYTPPSADLGRTKYYVTVSNAVGSDVSDDAVVIIGCGAETDTGNWLIFRCHNLGADETLDPFTWYSRGDLVDDDIKGFLFQWGRRADGHQKKASSETRTLATSNVPGHSNFIHTGYLSPNDWRKGGGNNTRWGDGSQNENQSRGSNDPCPTGWKVPSRLQWESILGDESIPNEWTWTGNGYKVGDALYLPAGGIRQASDPLMGVGNVGWYWSSTVDDSQAWDMTIRVEHVRVRGNSMRGGAQSVRCVKE